MEIATMLPDHVLNGSVNDEANFVIPAVRGLRLELIMQHQQWLSSGATYMPGKEKLRATLEARLAALEAFDAVVNKALTKKKLGLSTSKSIPKHLIKVVRYAFFNFPTNSFDS